MIHALTCPASCVPRDSVWNVYGHGEMRSWLRLQFSQPEHERSLEAFKIVGASALSTTGRSYRVGISFASAFRRPYLARIELMTSDVSVSAGPGYLGQTSDDRGMPRFVGDWRCLDI